MNSADYLVEMEIKQFTVIGHPTKENQIIHIENILFVCFCYPDNMT